MTRTAGAPIGCQRPSRFWGLGCPKIYHEAEDTLDRFLPTGFPPGRRARRKTPAAKPGRQDSLPPPASGRGVWR
ncbi:hypothetical protein, partial [Thiolapillus sp.]|uniref:hypothetical protein n=1 Tax=Thiolapillus sp. TaxID=2017437 RepID=UPI003AF52AF4